MKLIPNIRKYFSFHHILGASEPDKCLRPYISIIRQLTKLKYNITSQDFRIRKDKEIIRTQIYTFVKKAT